MNNAALKSTDDDLMSDAEYRKFLDTYTLTAKLLAAEDIDVMFSQKMSHPAVFDIKRRILKLAPLVKRQVFLTLGLIIHEVGHALFTNPTDADMKKMKGVSVIMNIIEDGYQERKVCVKFPGAKRHLKTIFDHFFNDKEEQDTAKKVKSRKDSKVIEIVNTLNYNCKGIKYGIRKDYPAYVVADDVRMLMDAETLNNEKFSYRRDVAILLSQMLRKYLDKNEQMPEDDSHQGDEANESQSTEGQGSGQKFFEDDEEEQNNNMQASGETDGESGEDGENDPSEPKSGETPEGDGQPGESNDKPGKKEPETKKPGTTGSSNESTDGDEDDVDLDKVFEQNADVLNDHHKKFEHVMAGENNDLDAVYSMPTFNQLKDISDIVDINTAKRGFSTRLNKFIAEDQNSTATDSKWKKDMLEAKKVATRIFTQFNMRKAARNLGRSAYKRNGALDPGRLSMYKIYDDIFSNIEVVPDVTNHAYVAVLDWSGSMDNSLISLTHRLMELAFFADMADVELEVVLYTSDSFTSKVACSKYPDMVFNPTKFIHVLNTKKHGLLKVIERLHTLWYAAKNIKTNTSTNYYGSASGSALEGIDTNGTTVLEGTIYGHGVLEKMQAQMKSLFVLTDGEDERNFTRVYSDSYRGVTAPNGIKDLIFMGSTVNTLIQKTTKGHIGSIRGEATRVICDFYKAVGHRTISISWNCTEHQSDQNKKKFGGMNTNFTSKNQPQDGYYKVENVFITDLVNNII